MTPSQVADFVVDHLAMTLFALEEDLSSSAGVHMRAGLIASIRRFDDEFRHDLADAISNLGNRYDEPERQAVRGFAAECITDGSNAGDRPAPLTADERYLQIARLVAGIELDLNLTSEDDLNLDFAVQHLEGNAERYGQLDKDAVRKLIAGLEAIAPEYTGEAHELVSRFAFDAYLEEILAEGDPVRLAELEAIRDADPYG